MADEEKAKAEKLAAARKRVEQMKKKKKSGSSAKKEEKAEKGESAADSADVEETKAEEPEPAAEDTKEDEVKEDAEKEGKESAATEEETVADLPTQPASHQRQPSLSVQSKMRSSSFRSASGPLSPGNIYSPEGETAPDIYRKQALRIEELEKENKRLAKEVGEGEKRWKRAEEELEDLREAEGNAEAKGAAAARSAEIEKLKNEIAVLQRQNTQLQAHSRGPRHGSSPSMSVPNPIDLDAALASKSATIESMEIEISNLRAQLGKASSGISLEKEQIAALEDKLARSEKAAAASQRELGDLKKNLERTTEKAVKEGSERTSAETKLRTLEREVAEERALKEELQKKVEVLEKKIATLTTLHKEHDSRFQAQKKEREKSEKEASDLRSRLGSVENENLRLKEERERARKRDAEGVDDDGVDELENEERQRLEKKVRDLEAELYDLRRGIWHERRKEMEGEENSGLTSPGARFTDVDLGGNTSPWRRRSIAPGAGGGGGKGIGDFITSGFNAITGAATAAATSTSGDGLLDDDMDFDEDAFRRAHEEEAKNRLERVKELKRGLKNWEGWRLDLVESRRLGGEGVGEIFEV
ncbi:hypothetical protein F5884DRAFT_831487 [Xylogone sp. PMI_703]|nr:hypothetical protein F5884DRAFT_831487 [Xylogone sp. PMI_703]